MVEYTIPNGPENLTMVDLLGKYPQGLAKSCRFAVRFLPAGGTGNRLASASSILNDLTYLCEAAELPGRSFLTIDPRYYGPVFRLPVQSVYEDVTFTFLVRADSQERMFFDDWMNLINPVNSWDFAYRTEYASKIQIFQLADTAEDANATAPDATYAITLNDTYPVTVNPQPMAWADDNFQRLVVTFTHDGWYREGRGEWPPSTNSIINGARIVGTPFGR